MTDRAPPLELRLLTFADGPRMLAINRACPVVADLSFYFERAPDFFAWPNAVLDGYVYVGGFRGPDLVAYAMFGTVRGQLPWGGEFSWSGDARVLPEARGTGFLAAAARLVVGSTPDSGVGLALVKQGNLAGARAVFGLDLPGMEASRLCEFRAVNLLLIRRGAGPRRYEVRRSTISDLPALAELLRRACAGRPFAPPVDGDEVARDAARLPGFGLDRYYLALDGGEPVGAIGVWDGDAVRRITVTAYSRRARLIRGLYGAARLLFHAAPPLPAPGGSLRAVTITRMAVPGGEPAVLRDLLAAVCRDHAGRGYHLVHVGFAGADPLIAATHGFAHQTFRSDLVVLTSREKADALRAGPLPYVDLRLL